MLIVPAVRRLEFVWASGTIGRMGRLAAAVAVLAALVGAGAAGAATLKQTTSDALEIPNSFSCSAAGVNKETSYYRRFDVPDSGQFTVSSVTFGIESAAGGGDASQQVTVKTHSIPTGDAFITANLVPLDSKSIAIADSESGSLHEEAIGGAIADPATTDLVVEVLVPDGTAGSDSFLIGSNTVGESAPTYIRAPDCAISDVTEAATAFPGSTMDGVLFVTGDVLDTMAPALHVKVPVQTFHHALTNGLRTVLSADEKCGLDVTLLIPKSLATHLGIPRLVGSAHAFLGAAGKKTVTTDFTRKARHALAERAHLSLTVRATATDPAHNAKTVSKSVTL